MTNAVPADIVGPTNDTHCCSKMTWFYPAMSLNIHKIVFLSLTMIKLAHFRQKFSQICIKCKDVIYPFKKKVKPHQK